MDEKQERSRYIVGIDLGTTNSSAAYIDTEHKPFKVENFPILQITAPGEAEALDLFPSFYYEAAESEFSEGAINLPWHQENQKSLTGVFARDHGAQTPGRLVVSAKSWLSHSGVDRTAPLLPWRAAQDVQKISPLDATSCYLKHVHQAWNHEFPQYPLNEQDVIITVPASFDEIARELTVTAAARAGLSSIVLLEEPQAAFYSWINQHLKDWQSRVNAGQKILVCDIGGGTTDFSLIQVRGKEDGSVEFHRISVGDHLILGGDNLDLALAYHIEKNHLKSKKLSPGQFGALVRSCQRAKEILLGHDAPQKKVINIAGAGSALIGGSLQVEVDRDEVTEVLLDGFFPVVDLNDKPVIRQSGFQEFGLPYAPDAAATKYLASFLTINRKAAKQFTAETGADPARPDIILFNGGVFSSESIRNRIIETVGKWFSKDSGQWQPQIFKNIRPELAVSRGAAYFGLVRRGCGVRISAGLARSYYIVVETEKKQMRALCLAPAGLGEGESIELTSQTFDLLIRQPVEFELYVSSRRTTDEPGELVEIYPLDMYALPPIRTVLRSGKKQEAGSVKVVLNVKLTEIGTLDLWFSEQKGNRSWRLQFDVRSATRTDIAAHKGTGEMGGFLDNATLEQCRKKITDSFRVNGDNPHHLIKNLEEITATDRNNWPPSLLRTFWEVLMEVENGRKTGPVHEARWLNFLGFSLRPGYGYAVDDWRVKQTWLLFQKGIVYQRNQACRSEWWIFWRRIAGGLVSGQQRALAQPLIPAVKQVFSREKRKGKGKQEIRYGTHELAEIWRLLGSLEHLQSTIKQEIGNLAKDKIKKRDSLSEALVWAMGRLGARVPVYGPLNEMVSQETASSWAEELILRKEINSTLHLALMQLCRKTNDRYRDIDEKTRESVLEFMTENNAPHHFIVLVKEGGVLDEEEQNEIFGEQLPKGLILTNTDG